MDDIWLYFPNNRCKSGIMMEMPGETSGARQPDGFEVKMETGRRRLVHRNPATVLVPAFGDDQMQAYTWFLRQVLVAFAACAINGTVGNREYLNWLSRCSVVDFPILKIVHAAAS